jgi:hypothetical protein
MFNRRIDDNALYLLMLIKLAVISLWVNRLVLWLLGQLWGFLHA